MTPYTRYFWKELTEDGRLLNAEWANPEGYEHQDDATLHFHLKFSIEPDVKPYAIGPRYTLKKFYGVK